MRSSLYNEYLVVMNIVPCNEHYDDEFLKWNIPIVWDEIWDRLKQTPS